VVSAGVSFVVVLRRPDSLSLDLLNAADSVTHDAPPKPYPLP